MANHIQRWAVAVDRSDKPAYVAIADAIAEDIRAGQLSANQKLPTLRDVAASMALNFTTVARGYAEAQRRGLIDSRPGHGTVVRAGTRSAPTSRPAMSPASDMSMNLPPEPGDAELLERFREGFASLQTIDPYELLRYQEAGGQEQDRDAGVLWLADRVPGLDSNRLLLTPGIQGGLLAVFAMLARPGDVIACEALTYPGIKGVAVQLGIRLQGLEVDAEGLVPEAFAELCRTEPPRALYCNPTLLNPTTAVMSLSRRQALVEIARQYAVPIIEDDAYGLLPSAGPPAIATLAPELCFYLCGFAKHVGAGLRIAYVAAPNARYASRLAATLRATAVMTSAPTATLATRWIHDGTATAATSAIREASRQRQQLAADTLRRARYAAHAEGFHLWLSVPPPWNRVEFAAHLRAHRISVVAADTFTVGLATPEAVRICLGGAASLEDCRHSLEIIEDAIEQHPALASRVM